ncbi:MAG TPA: Rpp14/Pop5 family protein [Methanoregulaceae archaeon]|nr:MAG: ribonuclease P [Methanolinea sp.]HON82329.1 Rpp14/Pop5 family protein [Methanoregulaceae archaeon]HPD11132.1 Rpp14/Pop5 family protein [Methanoregulaceae archaeon]HRT16162.1 Rpp14/Pop5 family protein [Methanoregulaceae archaeon]HRU31719.1 Rpp14/Pop5 family protein [Methanoregulaceae archaeon]
MKPLPPTLRTKKRYILATIEPMGIGADQKELYQAVSCALTSLFGDVRAAMISPAVIDSGPGHLILRCTRGGERDLRIALSTVTVAGNDALVLRPKATSGTLHALRRRIPRVAPPEPGGPEEVSFGGKVYCARRYQGQKVDLMEKGIKSQELLFLTKDDLEE